MSSICILFLRFKYFVVTHLLHYHSKVLSRFCELTNQLRTCSRLEEVKKQKTELILNQKVSIYLELIFWFMCGTSGLNHINNHVAALFLKVILNNLQK